MSHLRKPTGLASAFALAFALIACCGLMACGGSSSTPTSSAARAAASAATTPQSTTPSVATKAPAGGPSTPNGPEGAQAPRSSTVRARIASLQKCLQKYGVAMPPPGSRRGFLGGELPKGMTRTRYVELVRKCGAPITTGAFHPTRRFNSPRFRQALTSFAACLRQNGINLPAPNTSGRGPIFNTRGIDTSSTKFQEARRKCRSTLLGALRPGGKPGATSGTSTGSAAH